MTNIPEEIVTFMQKYRALGYAVAVFTPEELRGLEPETIEYHMISEANDMIDYLADEETQE